MPDENYRKRLWEVWGDIDIALRARQQATAHLAIVGNNWAWRV